MTAVPEERGPRPGRRAVVIALEVFTFALALHLLAPRIAGFEKVGRAIARGSWLSIVALVVFEAASLLAYGELVRVVLRSMGERVSLGLVQRTTLVGTSLGRTLPGGTTTALAIVVNRLRRAGLDGVRSTAALATSGLLSSFVLALLLVPAVAIAIVGGEHGGVALAAGLAAAAIVAVVGAIVPAVRHPEACGDAVERVLRKVVPRPLWHHVDPVVAGRVAEHAVTGIRLLVNDRSALLRGLGFAAANWLLDVAALTAVAVTVGRGTPLTAILLVYVVGQLAAAIPLTPGGVGIVETAMIGSFVASGAPVDAATATVLGWRLFSYWLPILAGLGLLPTLPRRRAQPAGDAA
jgi:uncharacterized membrane protein YbhN (UPF0104 family)